MKIKFLSIFSVAVLALSSCSSSDFDENNNGNENGTDVELSDVEVKFGSSLALSVKPQSSPLTRAYDDKWEDGDLIGVYMIKDEATPAWNIINGQENMNYENSNTGQHPANEYDPFNPNSTAMFYPTIGNVNFVAYYPYSSASSLEGTTPIYSVDISNQTSQKAIDLLYAARKTTTPPYNKSYVGVVELDFVHKLSKIILKVIAGSGVTDDEVKTVKISFKKYLSKTELDIKTGALATSTDPITIANLPSSTTTPSNVAAQFEAIIVPQKVENDMVWEFQTASGEIFSWKPSNESTINNYDEGKRYTYEITLQRSGVEIEGKVEDWAYGGDGMGVAE